MVEYGLATWWHGSYYRSLLASGTDRWGPCAVPARALRASWALVALVPCGAPYGLVNVPGQGPSGWAVALARPGRTCRGTSRAGRVQAGRAKSGAGCLRNESNCRRRRHPRREEPVEDFARLAADQWARDSSARPLGAAGESTGAGSRRFRAERAPLLVLLDRARCSAVGPARMVPGSRAALRACESPSRAPGPTGARWLLLCWGRYGR